MKRITIQDVQTQMELTAAALGKLWERDGKVYSGSPYGDQLEPIGKLWDSERRVDGRGSCMVGVWHLSQAYGGVCVHETVTDGGGVTTPVDYGHAPKREVWDKLQAMRRGALIAKESQS